MNGKKIGIFSPSNNMIGIFPLRNLQGQKNLKKFGFNCIYAKNAHRINTYKKESVIERLNEINQLIDENVDILLASIGGYLSIQLLNGLNYDKIREKNIIICGSSDITAILLAVYVKTNMITLYGPTYTVDLCDYEGINYYIKDSFVKCIFKRNFSYTYSKFLVDEYIDWTELETTPRVKHTKSKDNDWKIIKKGICSGKLIGGNLATLILILGTEYLPIEIFKNKILFLEDCETNINEFCSYLECLKHHGIYNMINGVVFGKFDTLEMNNEIEYLLKDYFDEYNFPVICNLDFGHVNPKFTIPIGADAEIVCINNIQFKVKF